MAFDPAQTGGIYMAMEYEGMGKTNNDGESITLTNKGFVDRSISAVTRAGDNLIAVEPQLGESTGVFVSTDHGAVLETDERCQGVARRPFESDHRNAGKRKRFCWLRLRAESISRLMAEQSGSRFP